MEFTNIIAIANQKGGVGKTTTAINLAHALSLHGEKVLLIDLDPQGSATAGMGFDLEKLNYTTADLLNGNKIEIEDVIYHCSNIDFIPTNPLLAQVARSMIGSTNSELRLAQKLKKLKAAYSVIIIDAHPGFGPLLNSALNAATGIIVPVDSSYYAMIGIKELHREINLIKEGTNPGLQIYGYLLTLMDNTKISNEVAQALHEQFGDLLFKTKIRRAVCLREACTLGKDIFSYKANSVSSEEYNLLAYEVLSRLKTQSFLDRKLEVHNENKI